MAVSSRTAAWSSCHAVIMEFLNKSESIKYVGPTAKKFHRWVNNPEGKLFLFAKELKPNRNEVIVERLDNGEDKVLIVRPKQRQGPQQFNYYLSNYKVSEQFAPIRELQQTLLDHHCEVNSETIEGEVIPRFTADKYSFADQAEYRAAYLKWLKFCRDNYPDNDQQPDYNQELSKVVQSGSSVSVYLDRNLGWVVLGKIRQTRVADLDLQLAKALYDAIKDDPDSPWSLKSTIEQRLFELQKGVSS